MSLPLDQATCCVAWLRCGRMSFAADEFGGRQEETGRCRECPWEEGQGRDERSGVKGCSDWDSAGQDRGATAAGRPAPGNSWHCHCATELTLLPVKQRIHFKIATLTYRTLQSGSPSYLSSLINLNAPSRLLRSSSHNLLHVPFTTTAIGRKAFSFAAPTVWNSIPLSIRQSPCIVSFKRHLKTHLFTLPG